MKKQNNIVLVLLAISLVFKLFAFTQEIADPMDFGDEIPVFIGLVIALLNRFLYTRPPFSLYISFSFSIIQESIIVMPYTLPIPEFA